MIRELRLEANGLGFRALATGPRSGTPMLLLHGFPEGAESWLPALEALEAAGVRAIAPDLRGFGGSDAPEGVESYGMSTLIKDVVALTAALGGGPIHLSGHDWGSALGWSAVTVRPELFRTWTALSVPHPADFFKAIATDDDQRTRSSYMEVFRQVGVAEDLLAADGHARLRAMYQGKLPDSLVDRYIAGFSRPGRLTAALNYYRANSGGGGGLDRPVAVPTVMIWGDQDVAVNRLAVEATADRVRADYRLHVLEGAGHWLQYERAAEVSRILVGQATSG